MASSESPARAKSVRSAAARAALAIRSEAQDDQTDAHSGADGDDYDAASQTPSGRRVRRNTTTSATLVTRNKLTSSDKSTPPALALPIDNLVPDLEDLVADAARVRVSGRHSPDYHHFATPASRERVHDAILVWYDAHFRKLPWRRDFHNQPTTTDEKPGQRAYEVWVSEIMCQQTQVATVIPYYNAWMAKWPTIEDLAAADIEDVNKQWTGLGYYSRASRLHSGAQKVLNDFNGVLPSDPVVLEKEVPGIGRYTAGAIASQAYNVPAELVDGNVIRVLSRLRAIGGDVKSPKVIDLHWKIAKELVHQNRPGCFNQGLMELGATVCTPQNPKCGECPVQSSCRAYAEMLDNQESRQEAFKAFENRSTRADDRDDNTTEACKLCVPQEDMELRDQELLTQYPRKACAVSILERIRKGPNGKPTSEFLLVKRPEKGLLAGMWEFPTVEQSQLRADHNQPDTPSTYKQRSESSQRYLVNKFKFDWIKTCKDIQRRDLGSVQHLFSHIRKVYHAEWVLVVDGDGVGNVGRDEGKKNKKAAGEGLEVEWLTAAELGTAAIPTGINKTFQLLQKYKARAGNDVDESSSGRKRKKLEVPEDVAMKAKKVKKEDGLADISKFFKPSAK
ncbi:hypothetical protein BGZ99_004975 [Dissophora globulifera]|uniref:Adenine DNA glycosylase n=1 Tax=Dissophora globulifera TaxID=979702 RepID=A0A9P6RG98_9FUNG|nr:hypothetical protein BGZ99_004975 [Dissophora globulifera]